MSSQNVKEKITELEKRFNELKKACRECLEKCKITVRRVTDALTGLPADEHKQFIESHLHTLRQSSDHYELIGMMSYTMNYLSYQLLDCIVDGFKLEIKNDMETYKKDLKHFREETPLAFFAKHRQIRPSLQFRENVVEFDWPNDVTLEVVEQF